MSCRLGPGVPSGTSPSTGPRAPALLESLKELLKEILIRFHLLIISYKYLFVNYPVSTFMSAKTS